MFIKVKVQALPTDSVYGRGLLDSNLSEVFLPDTNVQVLTLVPSTSGRKAYTAMVFDFDQLKADEIQLEPQSTLQVFK